MSQIEVPDWVLAIARSTFSESYYDKGNTDNEAIRAALTAALGAWVVPVGKVCMNGRRYGHGLFADIEVQYPTTTTPGPSIGSDLYTLRQEKPE